MYITVYKDVRKRRMLPGEMLMIRFWLLDMIANREVR